mgnify:CR=1 FL=1
MQDKHDGQQLLEQHLRQGAQLRTNNGTFFLAFAKIQLLSASEYGLTILSRHPEEPRSRPQCYRVTHFDQDPHTGKTYLAYSDQEYVQMIPLPASQLLTATTLFQQEYLYLTNEILPQKARQAHWPVTENHCLQRILLDHLFGAAWYQHLRRGKNPAYRQLSMLQLSQLLYNTHQLGWASRRDLEQMNQQSLFWRKKGNPEDG